MRNLLLKIKIKLKRKLPKSVFNFILKFTRLVKNLLFYMYNLLLFRKRKVVDITYGDIKFKLILDPVNGYLDRYLFFYRQNELEIKSLYKKYLKTGDIALDVGANNGEDTLFLAKLVGEHGKVYSFEPIKFLAEQTQESVNLNKLNNVIVNDFALGEVEQNTIINIEKDHTGGSSIFKKPLWTEVKLENIKIKTLDSLTLPKVDLIKINTEGYEWNTLKGGKLLVERDRPIIIFEFNPIIYEENEKGEALKSLYFFKDLNYKLYDLENLDLEIIDFEKYLGKFRKNEKTQSNLLALPDKT